MIPYHEYDFWEKGLPIMRSVTWAFGHQLGRKSSPPFIPRGRRGDRNLLILLFISKADPLLVAAATSPK